LYPYIDTTGKYATQASGIQWHETALRYSALVRKKKDAGGRGEEKAKKKELRKEEGTLKAALVTDLSNPGIRKRVWVLLF
jgi:hypothetical protein